MDKNALMDALDQLGTLLELDGANTFKVAAYQKAVRALSKYEGDLDAAVQEKTLTEIDGIGKGIAEKIHEFAASGRIEELDRLRETMPLGLEKMTRIPGFGAKKARAVWQELGIEAVDELAKAAQDGRLAALKGFGAKTAEKVLKGIEQLDRYAGQYRIDKALEEAKPLLEALRALPEVKEANIAGSLRRAKEIVKDIDMVAATTDPKSVMAWFVGRPEVINVIGHGDTKSSVQWRFGIQVDLRCVTPEQYPYALLHFTGSKEHNTRLRARAKEFGLKLNEYGLFPEGEEKPLPAKSEAEIYRHLQMAFVEPELREDRGEVEAAADGKLPVLVKRSDLKGLLHMHTHYSDGKPRLEQYAEWAAENGIQWMGIADHSQSLTLTNGLTGERVLEQGERIDEVNAAYKNKGVRLLKGIESDILLDGSLDYADDFLGNFEFIVASVHTHFNLPEKEQTGRIIRAMENPHTTVLGHMTGRLLLQRDAYAVDQREIIRAAARLGVAIEINANPRRLDLDWRLVHFAIEQGCRLSIGPDAHIMAGLEDTEYGLLMARKGWVESQHLVNCLTAQEFLHFARSRR